MPYCTLFISRLKQANTRRAILGYQKIVLFNPVLESMTKSNSTACFVFKFLVFLGNFENLCIHLYLKGCVNYLLNHVLEDSYKM